MQALVSDYPAYETDANIDLNDISSGYHDDMGKFKLNQPLDLTAGATYTKSWYAKGVG